MTIKNYQTVLIIDYGKHFNKMPQIIKKTCWTKVSAELNEKKMTRKKLTNIYQKSETIK